MRKAGFLFLFSFITLAVTPQGGKPYAIWEDQSAGFYRYVRLDAATGIKTNISALPGIIGFVAGNTTAYDPVNNYYHFTALVGSGQKLFYTLDATNGTIISNPALTHTLVGIEYNKTDSTLYALRVNSTSYDIVTLDPVTGIDTMVIPIGNLGGYVAESFCLNTQLSYYSFVALIGSNYVLKTYNLNTKTSVAAVLFPDNVAGHRYSCFNNAVFGLWDNNNSYKLEMINQVTGVHTTVGTLAGVTPGFVTESQSIGTTGKYTFRGFDAGNNFALFTADVSNASIVATAPTFDNAIGFEETGTCSVSAFINESTKENFISIFPVPVTKEITIRLTADADWLEIISPEGKIKAYFKGLHQQIILKPDVSEWAPGIYFIRAGNKMQTFTQKFILAGE